jgi:hypothetical protein
LYDLQTDEGEKNNIADKHPDVVQKIRKIMEQQHRENPDFPLYTKSAQAQ